MLVRRLMQSRIAGMQAQPVITQRSFSKLPDEKPENFVPYESPLISTLDRYQDEPEPQENEMIKAHYLKHHPMHEFRNFEEFHVDAYRHWLHARPEYYNSESSPADISVWEKGSKFNHMLILLFPFFSFWYFGHQYKNHLRQHKNVKMPIAGVSSQTCI